jgi:hypothetical protein
MMAPMITSRLVSGMPKTAKLVDGVSVSADVVEVVGAIVEAGNDKVVEIDVVDDADVAEVDVRGVVESVDDVGIEALPVVPIITTEGGKLSSTVAYPLVS